MKIAHVIGNGPSKKNFVNEPRGAVIGCNLGDDALALTVTVIMDKVVIDHIHNNNIKLKWPIACPQSLKRIAEQCPYPLKVIYTFPYNVQNGESTGHHACVYALQNYDEVHLWGFDAVYKDTIESDTHQKIPNGPTCATNYKAWRTNWDKVLKSPLALKRKIIFHPPT